MAPRLGLPEEGFFFGVLLFLLLRLLTLLYNLLRFPRLGRAQGVGVRASILVPARNEAENLKETLPRLLCQPAYEILLLDDLSWDRTGEMALALAGQDPRFCLLRGTPPPPGWRGKNWACWRLAQAAQGEVLVFTDADVLWEEGTLEGLLAALEGKDLVSVLPAPKGRGLAEVGTSFMLNGLLTFLPHPLLEALRLANGQVLAFRREAYFAQGGHEAVREEVLEDVALARRAGRYGLYLGAPYLGVRMYRTYRGMVEGFGKNLLEIHLKNPFILMGSAFYHLSLYTLPWLFGEWGLGLLGLLERLLAQSLLGGPLLYALLTPLAPPLLLPAYLRALLPGKTWKGRQL